MKANESTLPPQLVERRKEWENNLIPMVVSMNERNDTFLVVARNVHGRADNYYCFRYFIIGGSWECSIDGAHVPIDAVFSWLNDPSACTTRAGRYVFPTAACDL